MGNGEIKNDDKRVAVGFNITLSIQLIASSMAMLTVEMAYVSYALGSRITTDGFIPCAVIAGVFIILSIICAGKGIVESRDAGFKGDWSCEKGKKHFNFQATSLLLALLLLFLMLFMSGQRKEPVLEQKVDELLKDAELLKKGLETQRASYDMDKKEFENQLKQITLEVQSLKNRHTNDKILRSNKQPPVRQGNRP